MADVVLVLGVVVDANNVIAVNLVDVPAIVVIIAGVAAAVAITVAVLFCVVAVHAVAVCCGC